MADVPKGWTPPTRADIFIAQAFVISSRRIGRGEEIPDYILRDAEWPLEQAAPYPKRERSRRFGRSRMRSRRAAR